jgi:superfamily II DNA or RNA helicase
MRLTINNFARLGPVEQIPGFLLKQIKGRLTFGNPAYLEAEKRGFSAWNIEPEIQVYQVEGDRLIIPRGFTRQLVGILRGAGVEFKLDDQRRVLPEVDFQFLGELRDFQVDAVQAMASRDFGTLSAATGSGKTVMALALVVRRRQPALIVVHTKELADQWVSRIGTFLGIPAREVGRIGGGKMVVGDRVSVGLVQSLYQRADEIAPYVGHLVVDECHRAPSRTFTEAVSVFDSKYMLGLSATPFRRDGLSRLIWWSLGDLVHQVDAAALVEAGHVLRADVVWRETSFEPIHDPSEEYSRMLSELTQDPERNGLIADDVAQGARGDDQGVCLVLSDRVAHCKALVATGQLIGEGFDCRDLSTLFLVTPIKFNGRLLQYLGRVLRPAPGKDRAVVYDYVDPPAVLQVAARSRARVYG